MLDLVSLIADAIIIVTFGGGALIWVKNQIVKVKDKA